MILSQEEMGKLMLENCPEAVALEILGHWPRHSFWYKIISTYPTYANICPHHYKIHNMCRDVATAYDIQQEYGMDS